MAMQSASSVAPFKPRFMPLMLTATLAAGVISRASSLSTAAALVLLYAVTLPGYVVYWSWIYPYYISPLRHVPTVPGNPLYGQMFEIIENEVGVCQREWHKQYGPIVRYFFPLGTERLSIADDDALKQMTVKNPYNYPKPVGARKWMTRILGEGILLAEGNAHVHQRKALTPGFSIGSIRTLAPIFWRKSFLMARLWDEEINRSKDKKTGTFEVLEWLNRTTLDIISEAGFGTDVNSLENPETPLREAYRKVFVFDSLSRLMHGLQTLFPLTKYIPAKMNRDMEASRCIILGSATKIIKEKQTTANPADKDILSLLVRDNLKLQAAGEAGLSFETMRDQVMTFLGAGHDTTATGVTWTLHLLSKHLGIQSKLREEIRSHYPFLFDLETREKYDISTIDPDHLPYLDNVCRESLRYIPPIPMTVRELVDDDKLGDYVVPRGTTVLVYSNAINRLPQYWGPTVDEFDPDRWDSLPDSYTTNAFMTFLQGPRGCIGRKFAETEMKILLCVLLSQFTFARDESVQDPEELKMWRLVLRPRDGVQLKVTKL
jgi:cytochrome P450